MGLQFYKPGEQLRLRVEILRIPPKRLVRFLGSPDDTLKLYLHMLDAGSAPCLGDECEYCPFPTRLFGYAPVLEFFMIGNGHWQTRRAILPITDQIWELAESDQRDRQVTVQKKGNAKNGRMEFALGKNLPPTDEPPFDVVSRMMARWGIRNYERPPTSIAPNLKIAG